MRRSPIASRPFDRFEVFRVGPGSGVVMDPAVWHGAPLADGGPARAIVLILEGTGREDVTVVRFEDDPVRIDGSTTDSAGGLTRGPRSSSTT